MSETSKKLNLDAALSAWPEGEKSASDWEKMALSVEARVQTDEPAVSAAAVSDANLFADPLGQSEEDGHNRTALGALPLAPVTEAFPMSMPADRERDRRSLQDLAKMAQMTPPPPSVSGASGVQRAAEAKKDDSGIVDLAAAAAADPGAAARAQSTPLASQGLFDDEPASIRPPPASYGDRLSQPVPSIPPMPISMAPASMSGAPGVAQGVNSSQNMLAPAVASTPSFAAPTQRKGNGAVIALVFGGLVAASAAAAGVFYVVKHRAPAPAPTTVAVADTTPKATATPAAQPAVTVASNDTTPPEANVDPNALPGTKPAAVKTNAGAAKPGAFAANAPAPKEEGPAKLTEKDLVAAGGPSGDLGSAMQKAAGTNGGGEQTPAAGSTGPQFAAGTVPQKPSQGAVTGALGAVLPGARACLGPDDPVSYASITFGSAGNVQGVSLTGGAAGKPAEACIKGALGKAKLAPFAEPTYTARITVRH